MRFWFFLSLNFVYIQATHTWPHSFHVKIIENRLGGKMGRRTLWGRWPNLLSFSSCFSSVLVLWWPLKVSNKNESLVTLKGEKGPWKAQACSERRPGSFGPFAFWIWHVECFKKPELFSLRKILKNLAHSHSWLCFTFTVLESMS